MLHMNDLKIFSTFKKEKNKTCRIFVVRESYSIIEGGEPLNVSTTEQCVSLFEKAKQAYATDVHFHPLEKETIVSFRIEGMMREHQRMKKQTAERIVAHLKFHSGMDIGERRLPQNGAITFHLSDGSLSIRLSTVPLRNGERMAARLLPLSTDIHLSQLPTTTEPVQQLQNLCRLPDGLVIFTGPTGSGKTTSLYAMLQHLVAIDSRHIISVEDPIEKPHDTYTQLQVNEQAGLDYSEALKAALRHDPDVLMVGEIRDEKTAQIAVRAAMTGHLVLTSLHTRHTSVLSFDCWSLVCHLII